MSKLKAPLLSLGAHGTIADTLSFQKRGGGTMARRKPIPIDRYTLPQAYQRWLYQDYVAYWHNQTDEVKQTWETNARRYHMTGFAYWMKYHLANLPDIVAGWRLDERTGITAIDFSKNKNNATLYVPTHTPGIIDYCLSFDGIDDYVKCPHDPSLNFGTGSFTIEFFLKMAPPSNFKLLSSKYIGNTGFFIIYYSGFRPGIGDGTWLAFLAPGQRIIPEADRFIHAMFVVDREALPTITVYAYKDGNLLGSHSQALSGSTDTTQPFHLSRSLDEPHLLDHYVLYNRALTSQDAKRHSERRYP